MDKTRQNCAPLIPLDLRRVVEGIAGVVEVEMVVVSVGLYEVAVPVAWPVMPWVKFLVVE